MKGIIPGLRDLDTANLFGFFNSLGSSSGLVDKGEIHFHLLRSY